MKKSGNSFFIIPKELCDEPKYGDLSAYAILLYGLLRDRNSLSTLNGWKDDNGEIYLFFSLEEISKKLHCKKDRAEKSVSELEKAGLVKKVRQGCNKPNKLYVVNILSDVGETEFRKSDLTLGWRELNPSRQNGHNFRPILPCRLKYGSISALLVFIGSKILPHFGSQKFVPPPFFIR